MILEPGFSLGTAVESLLVARVGAEGFSEPRRILGLVVSKSLIPLRLLYITKDDIYKLVRNA
jgi:hypothetical protein